MKVIFTAAALKDLEDIAAYLAANHPHVASAVERRLQLVIARIARWPESAQRVVERPEVRVAPLVRYPYKIFYRITKEAVIYLLGLRRISHRFGVNRHHSIHAAVIYAALMAPPLMKRRELVTTRQYQDRYCSSRPRG